MIENRYQRKMSRRAFLETGMGKVLTGLGLGTAGGILGTTAFLDQPSPVRTDIKQNFFTTTQEEKNEIDNVIADVQHQNTSWDVELDLDANASYLDMFPDHSLSYELAGENNQTIAEVTLTSDDIIKDGNIRSDKNEDWNDTLQLYAHPQANESLTLRFTEKSPAGIIYEENTSFPIEVFTDVPITEDVTPRIFSEVDLATLHPDKNIYQRARALLERFDGLANLSLSLFDASNNEFALMNMSDFIDFEAQRVMLPVQYFTEPTFLHQGELSLFHLLSHYVCTAPTTRNFKPSLFVQETGKLEEAIKERDQRLIGVANSSGGTYSLDMFPLSAKQYEQSTEEDMVFIIQGDAPRYIKPLVHAMTIFGNFPDQFIDQFNSEKSNENYLSPQSQQEILRICRHIFKVFETRGSKDDLQKIIPEYDRLLDFISHYTPVQSSS